MLRGPRGLACLLVLVVHAAVFSFPATYPALQGMGKVGVWLFFSLSAYLLTYQLRLRGLTRATLADYFVGRTLRIYPLFALAVLGYYLFGTAGIDAQADVWRALTFQQGYAHLWTIPVEFKFYFVLPVLVAIALRVQARLGDRGLILVVALATAAHQLVAPYWLVSPATTDTFPYLPVFLFGMVAALLPARPTNADRIGWAILASVVLVTPLTRHVLLGIPPSPYLVDKFLFFGLAWAVFVATQCHSTGRLARVLSNRILSAIGARSYSIYLVHIGVVLTLAQAFPQSVAAATTGVALSVAAGALLYRFAERPLASARRGVLGRLENLISDGRGIRPAA